jgi:hypothetical protein
MKGRVERAGVEHARHDQERDGPRERDPEDDSIDVVMVIGRQDEAARGGKMLDARDA